MKEIIIDGKEENISLFCAGGESEIVVRLVSEGSSVVIDEVFFTDADSKSVISIIHEAGKTKSRVDSRGVVKNGVKNVSFCNVLIPKSSHDCDTYVKQKFLLLGKTSKAEAIPGLEIMPNKVKAGHSSSVAPISMEQVFYLTSRGFSDSEAKQLIINGFLNQKKEPVAL